MNDDEVVEEGIQLCNKINGLVDYVIYSELMDTLYDLQDRLREARKEALDAGGVNDSWALEVDRLNHKLAQATNYVTDDAVHPMKVWFACERTVSVTACGTLEIDFAPYPPDYAGEAEIIKHYHREPTADGPF